MLGAFHIVKLAGDDPGEGRRRVQQDTTGHRGCTDDPLYQIRLLLRAWRDRLTKMPPPTLNSEEPEKGIDVMCALAFVRLARSGSYDVVTLASWDTDLAPALGEAHKLQAAKIEAGKWYDPSDRRTFGNIITEARFWTTSMNRDHFMG